jgi:hypothetical protein
VRVLNALVVDEIQDRDDGGINLIGLREDLYFDAVPVILEALSLFVEVAVYPEDRGKTHSLEFRLIEAETGRVIKEIPLRFPIPLDHMRPTAPLDPTLFEIPFERFGTHFLDILTDGEEDRRIVLSIFPREAYGEA